MDDVRLSHLNKDYLLAYLLTYLLTYVAIRITLFVYVTFIDFQVLSLVLFYTVT